MTSFALFATIAGLIAAVAWGSGDFLAAKASKETNPEFSALFVQLIGGLLFATYYLLFLHHAGYMSPSGLLYAAGAGILMTCGLLAFYKGLNIGPVSIVSPIGGAYPLVTTFVVILIFGQHLTKLQLFGVALVVVGIIAASGVVEAWKTKARVSSGVVFAVGAFIFWGLAFALLGQAINLLGWQTATVMDCVFTIIGFLVVFPFVSGGQKWSRKNLNIIGNKFVVIASLIQLVGVIAFNVGVTHTNSVAVITAISACYPALTIFLALNHFKEKVGTLALAGALTSIVGVVVLSLK